MLFIGFRFCYPVCYVGIGELKGDGTAALLPFSYTVFKGFQSVPFSALSQALGNQHVCIY